jgi:hypothetical protein
MKTSEPGSTVSYLAQYVVYWAVVGIPLVWGICKTVAKLPALFH